MFVYGGLQARTLEWVAISSTMGPSQPSDWTCVSCISCIDRQILYHWATWEAPPMGHSQSITERQRCTWAGPFLGCMVFLWWAILAGGLPDSLAEYPGELCTTSLSSFPQDQTHIESEVSPSFSQLFPHFLSTSFIFPLIQFFLHLIPSWHLFLRGPKLTPILRLFSDFYSLQLNFWLFNI